MFINVLLVELGFLLIYGGVKGKSVMKLIVGDNSTPAKPPAGSITSAIQQGQSGTTTPPTTSGGMPHQ
jgi:hypothetical protein